MSYNVKYFSYDNNDPLNYFTIASLMRELKADIICLQELDSCTTRTNGHFQLPDLPNIWDGTITISVKQ